MASQRKSQAKPSDPLKTSPAPQLATPTDMSSQAVQAIAEILNPLIADAFVLYIKTKNFRWHLAGPHFHDYDRVLEEQATQIFAVVDILAVRIRCIGGTTIRSLSHIHHLQTLQDDNEIYVPAKEMVRRLLEDNAYFVQIQRAAHAICVQHQDVASAQALVTIIDETEHRIWSLFEITQAASSTE